MEPGEYSGVVKPVVTPRDRETGFNFAYRVLQDVCEITPGVNVFLALRMARVQLGSYRGALSDDFLNEADKVLQGLMANSN
ncbi:MAG: hypothetical protein ABIE03_03905 [Patescibacteria group bacterium]|nr:hypothetical protein [Patescibacteria group bacterium]